MVNMSMKLDQSIVEVNLYDGATNTGNAATNVHDRITEIADDLLVEKVWRDLDKQVPRDRVSCIVYEVALGFQNATVKAFLPILVHRRAIERLRQEIIETAPVHGCSLDEKQ